MATIYKSLDELPPLTAGSQFWQVVGSDHLRELTILQLINELKSNPSGDLTDQQCRSKLAKCEAYVDTIMFREQVSSDHKNRQVSKNSSFDRIPEA